MKTTFISSNLRRHRKARGLTQTQVARILGLRDHNRLSNWERGKCFPTVKTLFRLAAIYHTLPHTLYLDMHCSTQKEICQRESEILKTAEALQTKQKNEPQRSSQEKNSTDTVGESVE
jgi:transcriptional regulator with XRE-family HTH domain